MNERFVKSWLIIALARLAWSMIVLDRSGVTCKFKYSIIIISVRCS